MKYGTGTRSPVDGRWGRRAGLLASVALVGATLGGCHQREEELDRAEAAAYASLLKGWCSDSTPTIIQDEAQGERIARGGFDFVDGVATRDSLKAMRASFNHRNRRAVRLSSLVGPLGNCTYMDSTALHSYLDTTAAYQSDALPFVVDDSLGGVVQVPPSVIWLSRLGFDSEAGTALATLGWGGGFGMCWGDYVILRRTEDGEWVVADRIQYIVC